MLKELLRLESYLENVRKIEETQIIFTNPTKTQVAPKAPLPVPVNCSRIPTSGRR